MESFLAHEDFKEGFKGGQEDRIDAQTMSSIKHWNNMSCMTVFGFSLVPSRISNVVFMWKF